MSNRAFLSILVLLMMVFAGCTKSVEDEIVNSVDEEMEKSVSLEYTQTGPSDINDGEIAIFRINYDSNYGYNEAFELDVILYSEDGNILTNSHNIVHSSNVIEIIVLLQEPGKYQMVSIWNINENYIWNSVPTNVYWNLTVSPPDQDAPIIQSESVITIEGEADIFKFTVIHESLSSCMVQYTVVETTTIPKGSVNEQGLVSVLIESENIGEGVLSITAVCGDYDEKESQKNIPIVITDTDSDGDGIIDEADNCPQGEAGWISNENNDYDGDGCRDIDEDLDDDNDSITDYEDSCKSTLGWTSVITEDFDQDGCRDSTEDDDDDNDGIIDTDDLCPVGFKDWSSDLYEDWDSDGCKDSTEDLDDDNDMRLDLDDSCPKGVSNWNSNSSLDFDYDGCQDSSEDTDDDNDGVNDVNETGVQLDLCPRTPLNSVDVDYNGCAAIERDTDQDGVNDLLDLCEGTPANLIVNQAGCADVDSDGIFANVDDCPYTQPTWTADSQGCAINQIPVSWTSASGLTGPMQPVPDFTVPTLSGTFTFQSEWNGEDVYLFMFKFTNSDGSSNYNTWNTNPGTLIRNLPDNAHLFYGSYDSTYHNDMVNKRTDVENRLSNAEEEKWQDRIHYIDMRATNIQGGLGDMLNSMNSAYFGIDRFQLARETGSLYAWVTQSNDPYHLSYEPNQWNAEFEPKVRPLDYGVEVVTIYDFERHQGGWGGNHNSYRNVNITLDHDISYYDTLEVYHEHACDERRNRYQKADSSYGGCHEWDYEANMYLCNRENSSVCNVEFMRWITTYGREGMWLTDISPYIFMLQEDENRRFRYKGANKGDLTIQLIFSRQGGNESTSPSSATFAFTGGQFDGSYNNESRYVRSLNFSVPQNTSKVEIVATITGHGFQKDDANCAEFCDHEHHYYIGNNHAYEWHPIVGSSTGCEGEINNGVVANQFGSWPYGRAGWCAGQDVKQWTYDITDWVDFNSSNELLYRGLFNGQEYQPTGETQTGGRNIHAEIWVVYYSDSIIE